MQVKKICSVLRYFRCPSEVTLEEVELCTPPEIIASITEGKIAQRIPEKASRVEMLEMPEVLSPPIGTEVEKYVAPKQKCLEVKEWYARVYVTDSFIVGCDDVISALMEKCRQTFSRYRRIFLGKVELKKRVDRLLTWSLRSRLRYWWLCLMGRPVDFGTFPGRNRITFTLQVMAAME
ncbi:MAG: hypothetical protein DRG40_00340 [Deltaproteobacteria bacterium]|nr:MAG: hypothetical protein DRG40_00340 [Deltaproteobacteria bacterium]